MSFWPVPPRKKTSPHNLPRKSLGLGLGSRVTMAGLLEEQSLIEEFRLASALVLPSYQETAPMVIQQAMAAGLPVIATRVGGIPDQIEHDHSGLLFEPGDVVELCSLLRRLNVEGGLGERLAAAARVTAANTFTSARVAEATKRAYEQIGGGH